MKKQTQAQILEDFSTQKSLYEGAQQEFKNELTEIYNNYIGKMDNVVSTPYDTKETIPKLRTEIAYIKPYIFSGEPEIEIEGVGDEDRELSKILERMVNYRLSQSIPNAYGLIEDWVHQATTFGTSLIKVIWKFETKKNPDGTETPVVDEPRLEVPNIMDCYYNSMLPEVEHQKSIIFRSVLTLDEIKNNPMYDYEVDGKKNVDKLEPTKNFSSDPYNSSSQTNSNVLSNQDGMIELYEIISKDRIRTIAIGKEDLVLRDVKNPYGYINAVKLIFEPNTIPNTFNGLGVGQNTLGLGKSYYKLFNQILTNVKMTNNFMSVYAKGTRIDKRQLVSKPGGGIEVDTQGRPLNDVFQPIIFPDITQGAADLLSKVDDEHKRASGANDLVQGSASNDTLGQDQMAQNNISNRFELIQRRFKHALTDLAEMILKMDIENLQDANAPILRIFPDQIGTGQVDENGQEIMQTGIREKIFYMIKNDAPNIKYNIKVKGETTVVRNKAMESKRLIDLFDLTQNFLTDTEKRAFARRIAEKQGEDNVDELIGESNPQLQQEQGQEPQQTYNQINQNEQQ